MDPTSIALGVSNICCGGIIILLAIPLVRRSVKPNQLYGVRFKASYASEEAWYDINQYGGQRLILWSIPLVAIGIATLFLPLGSNIWAILLIACAPLIVIIPAVESWRYAKSYPVSK